MNATRWRTTHLSVRERSKRPLFLDRKVSARPRGWMEKELEKANSKAPFSFFCHFHVCDLHVCMHICVCGGGGAACHSSFAVSAPSAEPSPTVCAPLPSGDMPWILVLLFTAGQGVTIIALSIVIWRRRRARGSQDRGESWV